MFIKRLKAAEKLLSPLAAFFIGTLVMYVASGLNTSILAVRLNAQHTPTFYTGIVMAFYYFAYIVSSLTSSRIINKVGHVRAFAGYISILSSMVLLHTISSAPWFWALLRFAEGYCIAAGLMCLESWLNTRSNNQNRGVIMSVYMVMTYLGMAGGQLMLNIPDPGGFMVFIIISVLYSWSLVPVSLTGKPTPPIRKHKHMSLRRAYKLAPMSVVGCIISGILVSNVYTLGPIYADQMGLDINITALFMFFCIMGGMVAQIPVGRLSDKFDRRFVMMWLCGALFVVAPWMQFFIDSGVWLMSGCAVLLGAGTFVLYPICISHLNDKITDDERVEASGQLILLQSIGMMGGPIIVSFAMQQWGAISFVLSFSFFSGLFVLYAFKNIVFRPQTGYLEITKTDPVPASPTHVFPTLAQDDGLVDKAKKLFADKQN